MAKRRRGYRNSKCPEPISTILDLAGALTLGLYTRHRVKKDFEKGAGEESARAAGLVFGVGSMRGESRGIINLGGLLGLRSALKRIEREKSNKYITNDFPFVDRVLDAPVTATSQSKKYLWREYCEDGSIYGLDPNDYETADQYNDALSELKRVVSNDADLHHDYDSSSALKRAGTTKTTSIWRKYCEDGTAYGIYPSDYETADDYQDALDEAKSRRNRK